MNLATSGCEHLDWGIPEREFEQNSRIVIADKSDVLYAIGNGRTFEDCVRRDRSGSNITEHPLVGRDNTNEFEFTVECGRSFGQEGCLVSDIEGQFGHCISQQQLLMFDHGERVADLCTEHAEQVTFNSVGVPSERSDPNQTAGCLTNERNDE